MGNPPSLPGSADSQSGCVMPSTHFALPPRAAAAACRCRQRPLARFRRNAPSAVAGKFPAWQGCSAQASVSSRLAAVQAGSTAGPPPDCPRPSSEVRAAAARPHRFGKAPAAMRRGPLCLRGASARAARLPRCGTWAAFRRRCRPFRAAMLAKTSKGTPRTIAGHNENRTRKMLSRTLAWTLLLPPVTTQTPPRKSIRRTVRATSCNSPG